jgi:PIN domain nuclease of toxin-antitoxin system
MYVDTHVVVWLYEKNEERFSPLARELIESHDILLSRSSCAASLSRRW